MKIYQTEIDATHPARDGAQDQDFDADFLAMKLVGERHEKRELVNLVRWLILRKPQGLLIDRSCENATPYVPSPEMMEKMRQRSQIAGGTKFLPSYLRVGGNEPGINHAHK